MNKHLKITGAALGLLALAAAPAAAQTYKFKTVDYSKTDPTILYSINLSNVSVGDYTDTSGIVHCFQLTGAKKTLINDTKGSATQCYDINKTGTISGAYTNSGALTSTAFIYSGGTFTDIVPTGATDSTAYGISDKGVVIGTFVDSAGQHGFTYDTTTKKFATFNVKGASATLGVSINVAGQYTVQAFDANNVVTSYLGKGAKLVKVAFPNAATTAVHHINNLGQIALTARTSANIGSGGVFDSAKKTYYTINYPKADQTFDQGISDKQTLVGGYLAAGSTVRQGYIATGKL